MRFNVAQRYDTPPGVTTVLLKPHAIFREFDIESESRCALFYGKC